MIESRPSSQMYRFLRNVNNDLVGGFTDFWHNTFKGKNEPRVIEGGIMTMTLGRDGSVLASQITTPSSNAKADAFAIKFMEEFLVSKRRFDPLPSCYDHESIEIEFAYAKAAVIWIKPSPVYYERDWAYLDKRWEEEQNNK